VDFTGGFNAFFAAAYGLPAGQTIQQKYGAAFGAPCRVRKALQERKIVQACECVHSSSVAGSCVCPDLLSDGHGSKPGVCLGERKIVVLMYVC